MNTFGPQWQTKPPLGVRINAQNPMAQGLVGCWLFNEGGGLRVQDLCSNTLATVATGPTWAATQLGIGQKYTANVTGFIGAPKQSANLGSNPSTVIVWFVYGGSTGSPQMIVDRTNVSSAGWYMQLSGSNNFQYGITYSSSDMLCASSGTNSAAIVGLPTMFAVTGDGSGTAANHKLYVNGYLLAQTNSDGGGTQSDDSANQVHVAGNVNSGQLSNLTIIQLLMYNRQLGADAIQELYMRPWSAFRYPRPIWALPLGVTFTKTPSTQALRFF